MAELQVHYKTPAGANLVAPVDAPEIQVRRIDTQAIVQAFTAMTEIGEGAFSFTFAIPATGTDYSFVTDGDPNVTGQVSAFERFKKGSLAGLADANEAAINTNLDAAVSTRSTPADIAAAEANILAAIGALNDIDIADVQTALTNQGYTSARAAFLDIINTNLDVAVSTRNSVVPMDAATSQGEHDATQAGIAANLAAIGALNDIDITDVQTALTNQGYTAARALLLDNLDGTVSSVIAAIGALNDISVSDILTAVLASGNTVDAELSGILALRDFIEGGRDIDFTGNDALGWQRIERNVAGALVRRYNLFDENGARINETVASFIGRQGMISAEVAI